MMTQVENKLRAILTLHSEGVLMSQFAPLLPTWRQFGDAKLKPFLARFPNTAAVIEAGGAEWVVPARPLLLQTAKSGVTALLNRSLAKALDLDELVAAYAKQNNNANLDFVAELAGHKYVEDLLEEIGFVVLPNGERDIVTFRHGSAQQPQPVVISATLQLAPNDSKLTLSLPDTLVHSLQLLWPPRPRRRRRPKSAPPWCSQALLPCPHQVLPQSWRASTLHQRWCLSTLWSSVARWWTRC